MDQTAGCNGSIENKHCLCSRSCTQAKRALLGRHLLRCAVYQFLHFSLVFLGFPWGSAGKESACNAGDLGSTPGLGRSPGEGKGYPLQYSGLQNSMDCIVHGVTKNWTPLSDFHFHFYTFLRVETLSPLKSCILQLNLSLKFSKTVFL